MKVEGRRCAALVGTNFTAGRGLLGAGGRAPKLGISAIHIKATLSPS